MPSDPRNSINYVPCGRQNSGGGEGGRAVCQMGAAGEGLLRVEEGAVDAVFVILGRQSQLNRLNRPLAHAQAQTLGCIGVIDEEQGRLTCSESKKARLMASAFANHGLACSAW